MSESFKAIDPENVVRQITFGQAEALVFQIGLQWQSLLQTPLQQRCVEPQL